MDGEDWRVMCQSNVYFEKKKRKRFMFNLTLHVMLGMPRKRHYHFNIKKPLLKSASFFN